MIQTLTNLESHRETAINITQEIFSTMLGIEAWPVEQAPGGDRSHTVVGAIHFAGPWKGVLLLECQPLEASAFTAKLMGIPAPDSVDDDSPGRHRRDRQHDRWKLEDDPAAGDSSVGSHRR